MYKLKTLKIALFSATIGVFALSGFMLAKPVKAENIPLLIKSANSPAVYFVSQKIGAKKLIPSVSVFNAYGDQWAWVKTVSDEAISQYPDVNLVKAAESPAVYYINGRYKRLIPSVAIFRSLGFSWDKVLIINQTDLDSYQTGAPLAADSPVSAAANYDNQLVVSYAGENNPSEAVPTGIWRSFLKIKLQAGGDQPVAVNGLTVNLAGLNNGAADVSEIYLTDEKGEQIASPANINGDRRAIFNFGSRPIMVPANTSKIIQIYATVKTSGVYVGFTLKTSEAIMTEAEIIGRFPLEGHIFKIIDGDQLNARVTAEAIAISENVREVRAGAENQIIAKFRLSETTGQQAVWLKKIVLTKNGSLADENLADIDLVKNNNKIIATAETASNGQVVFDLSQNPLLLEKGESETFTIRGDLTGGDGETVQLVIKKLTDLTLQDKEYGYQIVAQGVAPIGASPSTLNMIRVVGGSAAVYFDSQGTPRSLISGSKDVQLAKFVVRATGLNFELNGFDLMAKTNGAHGLTDNLFVKYKNKIIADFRASDFVDAYGRINFDNEIAVKSGQDYVFEIFGSLDNAATNLDTYSLFLNNFQARDTAGLEIGSGWTLETGAISVKVSQASIVKSGRYGDFAVIAGKKKQLVGSFTLQVGAAEDQLLESATIEEAADRLSAANGFENLYLAVNRRIVATINSPLATTHIFTFKPQKLTKGKTYSLDFYADIAPEADGEKLEIKLTDLDLAGRTSNAEPQVDGLGALAQKVMILATNLDLTVEPVANSAIAGEKNTALGRFIITNDSAEKIRVDEFYLYQTPDSDEFSANAGFSNLRLVRTDNYKKKVGRAIAKPALGGNRLGGFDLVAGESVSLDIIVDTASAASGQTISLVVQDFEAYGRASKQTPIMSGGLIIIGPVSFNYFE